MRVVRALLLLSLLAAGTGCTSPNTYATARTVPAGEFQHTFAVEGVGFHHNASGSGALPVLPTYAMRVGLVERRLDVGARIGSLTEVGADLKLNLLRGKLDLAAAAGAEAFIEWNYNSAETRRSGAAAYFHFPLIASINFSREMSLVATPGITYVVGLPLTSDFARTQVFGGDTLAWRLGFGLDFRSFKKDGSKKGSAVHPEITILQGFSYPGTMVVAGIGFNFGTLPDYSDLASSEPEPPAPAPKPDPVPTPAPPPVEPTQPPAPPPPEPPKGEEIL